MAILCQATLVVPLVKLYNIVIQALIHTIAGKQTNTQRNKQFFYIISKQQYNTVIRKEYEKITTKEGITRSAQVTIN